MVFLAQILIMVLEVGEEGTLRGTQIPPGVVFLEDSEREYILVGRIEDIGSDALAQSGHRNVDVDLEFGIHRGVRLEFERQIAVQIPSDLLVHQEYDK